MGLGVIIAVLVYLGATAYLGWLGYRHTKNASDYLIAGRQVHPYVMAMSYGATFISTSAIVGFGGVAGMFGMSLLWLTFLNIFAGIFIAFIFLGGRTRAMGHRLDAHTFPELLGRRFQSRFIQIFCGLVIFIIIPLYEAAVLIGGVKFINTYMGIDYTVALFAFSVIVATYCFFGGLKGVMYADTLQGSIMFFGMLILLIATYFNVGGIVDGHATLSSIKDLVPKALVDKGHQGWTAMPHFGFGGPTPAQNDLWWTIVTTIVLGVGIGVLAQPMLAVRFMTVKSRKQLNRAVGIGGLFIFMMTGTAFLVGSLSNAYFTQHGKLMTGKIVKKMPTEGHAAIAIMQKKADQWVEVPDEKNPKTATVVLDQDKPCVDDQKAVYQGATSTGETLTGTIKERLPEGGKAVLALMTRSDDGNWAPLLNPKMAPVVLDKDQPCVDEANGIYQGRSISIVYAKGDVEQIIPTYITTALPRWFSVLFLLTLLAAAMSTLSSQVHVAGTSIGRDVFQGRGESKSSVPIVKLGIVITTVVAVIISWLAAPKANQPDSQMSMVIARATSIFFGMCAAAFLPPYIGGLYSKRMTKAAAVASMIAGFGIYTFWAVLVQAQSAASIKIVQVFTHNPKVNSIINVGNWPVVDALIIALPASILVAIIVSLFTQPNPESHLQKCFGKTKT